MEELYEILSNYNPEAFDGISKEEFITSFAGEQGANELYDLVNEVSPELFEGVDRQSFVQSYGDPEAAKIKEEEPKEEGDYLDWGSIGVPNFGKTIVGDWVDDMVRAVARGKRSGNTQDETLWLMSKGSASTGEEIKNFIEAHENAQQLEQSEEFTDFVESGGFGTGKGWAKFAKSWATILPEVMAESLAAMTLNPVSGAVMATGAGVGAAAGGVGLTVSMPIATALTSGTLETTGKFAEMLQEEINERGLDFTEEGIRNVLEDEESMARIYKKSLTRGITIGMIDGITGRIAGKVGAKVVADGLKGGAKARGVAKGLAIESFGGATGEGAAQVAAGEDIDITAIGLEGFAELPMGSFNVAAPYLQRNKTEQNTDTDTQTDEEGEPTEVGREQEKGKTIPINEADTNSIDENEAIYSINGEKFDKDTFVDLITKNPDMVGADGVAIDVRNDDEVSDLINKTFDENQAKKGQAQKKAEGQAEPTTEPETQPTTDTKEEPVEVKDSQEEFDNIVNETTVDDPVLAGIADKLQNGKPLTEEEDGIFEANIDEVDAIIKKRENQLSNQNLQDNAKKQENAEADSQEGADNRTETERPARQQVDGGEPSGQAPQERIREVELRSSKRGQRQFDIDGKTFTLVNQGKGKGWSVDGIDDLNFTSLNDAQNQLETDQAVADNILENANEVVEEQPAPVTFADRVKELTMPQKDLKGNEVELQAYDPETGQKRPVSIDAGKATTALKKTAAKYRALIDCLKS